MDQVVHPTDTLVGIPTIPADKSIAHRSALFAAIGDGQSQIVHYPDSADPQSTLSCLRALGVEIEEREGIYYVQGVGLKGLQKPDGPLDCGNSGTTMRLISGILAGQDFDTTLIGDASLSSRPMERIASPLREMGAQVELTNGHAPIHIKGGSQLKGITYRLPVPSAQIKSCVLLAGHYAEGETTVVETLPSRDHTERMLGLDVLEMNGERLLSVQEGRRVLAGTWAVPGDFSAAAFFLVAASVVPHADIRIKDVGMNTTRSALMDVLRAMGANIVVEYERTHAGEPLADLRIRSAPLRGVTVDGALIPNLIDEIPVLAVAAAAAQGFTVVKEAAELRVKETDRIAATVTNMQAFGVDIEEFEDGFAITGGAKIRAAEVESYHDHRIAMAAGIAALIADGPSTIKGAEAASVSFPQFWNELAILSGREERSASDSDA